MKSSAVRGHAVVIQPGGGPWSWQPVPANGHADPPCFPSNTNFDGLSMGFQSDRRQEPHPGAFSWRSDRASDLLSVAAAV